VSRARELAGEFRAVFAGRSGLIDSVLPPLLFVTANALLGLGAAAWISLGVAAALTLLRLARRRPLRYALGGAGATLLAVAIALVSGAAEGYFVPTIATGALSVLAAGLSVVAKRPLVAYTSHLARRWPLAWYWHPRVRPAYSEVTLAWAAFFAARLSLQWYLFGGREAGLLAVVQVVLGWPATVALLAASYLYGIWRLRKLQGPSVVEFERGAEPPWDGQRRGF
jgi:hypothetical protein